jgi:hypothetical protein
MVKQKNVQEGTITKHTSIFNFIFILICVEEVVIDNRANQSSNRKRKGDHSDQKRRQE